MWLAVLITLSVAVFLTVVFLNLRAGEIYWSGEVGRMFSEALCERARAGVKVHVLLDWVGTGKIETKYLDALKEAGVEVERYHPLRWYTVARINNRTHRKLLVVDGRIGFTGGVGIADQWNGHAQSKNHWRDSHYQLEGPAVAQMQAAFTDNRVKTRAKVLFGSEYFPELKPVGDSMAQVFKSSRGEGSESVRLMYLLSIASATKKVFEADKINSRLMARAEFMNRSKVGKMVDENAGTLR